MFQADEGTHITTIGEARPHHRHWMRVRTDSGARQWAVSRHSRRTFAAMVFLVAVALILIAAPVCVFLGEKTNAVSPSLWSVADDVCRVVAGLFGILGIVLVVAERRSGSSGGGDLRTVAGGAALIAAAAAGLGIVIVVTGLGGLAFLYAGGVLAVECFRAPQPEPRRISQRGKE
jgi:hypothetical protein